MTAATSGANPSGPTATGRPTRLPRSARRKQLLAAAQDVFVAQGYHAAAMDDIAERAGVSKPVLYQHFPGKLELYLALLDTHCDAFAERIRSAMAATSDNKDRVRGAMRAYFDFVSHESEAFRLVFESDLRNEPAVARGSTGWSACRSRRSPRPSCPTPALAGPAPSCSRPACAAPPRSPPGSGWPAAGPRPGRGRAALTTLSWRGIASFPLQGELGSLTTKLRACAPSGTTSQRGNLSLTTRRFCGGQDRCAVRPRASWWSTARRRPPRSSRAGHRGARGEGSC